MPEQEKRIELGGSVWMTVGGESLGGSGRVQLLALVGEQGSITHAAKAMKMSYKAAWDAIDTMNNLAGEPLVERVAGGKGGGGTRLTPRGQQLVENFRRIEAAHQRFVAQLGAQAQGIADDYLLIRNISMKTSARNHFAGTVTRVVHGAVNDEVEIEVRPGLHIVATVTHESAEGLGLAVGAQAYALVKASSIVVVTDAEGAKFSARNRLTGTIARLVPGAVNTEVVIDLEGAAVAAIITNESCQSLALAVGGTATAIFKASSVIVGAPA